MNDEPRIASPATPPDVPAAGGQQPKPSGTNRDTPASVSENPSPGCVTTTKRGVPCARTVGTTLAMRWDIPARLLSEEQRRSYYTQGDSIFVLTRISDTRNSRLLGTVGPIGGRSDEASELVGRVGNAVVGALAPLLDKKLGAWDPGAAPASLAAYEAYTDGLEAYLPEHYDTAASFFERAIAVDPTFTRARLWAAQSHMIMGWWHGGAQSEFVKAESLLAPLVRSREHLSRYERCRLDFVAAFGPRVNFVAMYAAARCMVQAAPGSDDARREVALNALRINRPAESKQLLEQLDRQHGLLKQWDGYWFYLSEPYHMLGDYTGELDVARQGLQRLPSDVALKSVEAGRWLRSVASMMSRPS